MTRTPPRVKSGKSRRQTRGKANGSGQGPAPCTPDIIIGVCKLCNESMTRGDSVQVTAGLPRLAECSAVRDDGLENFFKRASVVLLHKTCRRNYTDEKRLETFRRHKQSNRPATRSAEDNSYSPQKECLFCGKVIDFNMLKKIPVDRVKSLQKRVHSVQTMSMQECVMKAIEKRRQELGLDDEWTLEVESRVASMHYDFVAAEAKYHARCRLFFTSHAKFADLSNERGRPEDDKMMTNLCKYLDNSDECQFSMSRLIQIIKENGDEPCTPRWLKIKLLNKYGDGNILITQSGGRGRESVLNFSGFAGDVLQDKWDQERKATGSDMNEKKRVVELAAQFVLAEINKTYLPEEEYPSLDNMAEEGSTPELLKLFLETLITTKKTDKTQSKRKQLYIGQCIMLATRPKSYISPILLALAACLHREFGSKQLIDTLNSLGACHSYHEVKRYVYSLTQESKRLMEEEAAAAGERVAPADGFVQWVFDNADWLTSTLDGHNTFHCLGGAEITTPARTPPLVNVPRLALPTTAAEIAAGGHFIPKREYIAPEENGLALVEVRSPTAPSAAAAAAMLRARQLDALHLVGLWVDLPATPSWTGFMKKAMVCDGVNAFSVSSVHPTPFVDSDPTDPETLYSAITYADEECTRRQQKGCFMTFDNGLFPKAVQIVMSNEGLKQRVVVRLGGFHFLMNFMGAVGDIMAGSGLDDLWHEIYAQNTVVHMMTGKAYSRALRAHFLTQEAVGVLLLRSDPALDEDKKAELCAQHAAFLAGETTPADAAEEARELWNSLETAGESAAWRSPTGKLWWQYYQLVSLMRLFIRAERTGDWDLHLATTTAMEPLYYAAGHHLYARSTRLYLQTMEDLDGDLAEAARKGFFTVRRTSEYWAGVWTDMVVEQDIMRVLKGQGGQTARGLTESNFSQWVGSMPAMHKVSTALEKFCGVHRATSEQHVDLRVSRVSVDQTDRGALVKWLADHNPFDNREGIRCLSTGVMGSDKVTCHNAIAEGTKAMKKFVGKNFKDLKSFRNCRVITLAQQDTPRKKDEVATETNALFVSMCCLGVSAAKFREYVKYELTRAPPALFENGMMRHNCKSTLTQCFVAPVAPAALPPTSPAREDSPEPPSASVEEPPAAPVVDATRAAAVRRADGEKVTVVDGGYLLHVAGWPRPGGRRAGRRTYGDLCRTYVGYVVRKYSGHGPIKVVFDGYNVRWSTKCEEQRRRAKKNGAKISPDTDVKADLVCGAQREQFLGNTQNKSRFIALLCEYLKAAEVHVQQAEADADVLIVETALAEAAASRRVRVVATDTDVLAVLIARAPDDADITVVHPSIKNTTGAQDKTYNIASLRATLGDMVHCVLPVHALTGCDTTAAIYGKGKGKLWELVRENAILRDAARVFNEPEDVVRRETLVASGERLYMELYSKGTTAKDLNDLRYYKLIEEVTDARKKKKLSHIDLRIVPFTSDAGVQKTLRSYLQVQQWLGNNLTPTEWGWTVRGDDMSLTPLPISQHYAPEELLISVSCGCKTGCKVGSNCSCRKNKTHCTAACRSCRGEEAHGCTNTLEGGEGDDD